MVISSNGSEIFIGPHINGSSLLWAGEQSPEVFRVRGRRAGEEGSRPAFLVMAMIK